MKNCFRFMLIGIFCISSNVFSDSSTDLLLAVQKPDVQNVKALVLDGADVNAKDADGNSALMLAIGAKQTEIANVLLRAGADPNLTNKKGFTPLMAAAFTGNAEMVKFLLDKKADPGTKNQDGVTALDLAKKSGNTEVASLLSTQLPEGVGVKELPREADLVELTQDIVRPEILKRVNPSRPSGATQTGTVILSLLVSEKGEVEDIKVLQEIPGQTTLTEAAKVAVRRWQFKPATKDGVKVKVWATYPIVFKSDQENRSERQ